MFCKCLRRSLLIVLALPALAVAFPVHPVRPAALSTPQITLLQQQGKVVVVNWASSDSYDSYTVTWTLRGRPGSASPFPGGTSGSYTFPTPVPGTPITVQVQGFLLLGGIPIPSALSDPVTIIAVAP